jgi:hypothetical protein
MKSFNVDALLLCTLIVLPFHSNAETAIADQDLQEARSLVKAFGSDLKAALKPAMKSGGPVNAINVCHLQAGPIAETISARSDWQVNRTSLKVRNANNTPDKWELKTLLQFEQRKAAGEDLKTMEYSELITQEGQSISRYMKAIPTAGLCLKCHGSQLDDAVTVKLKALYPYDQAVGFNAGDLRGAFSLQKIK